MRRPALRHFPDLRYCFAAVLALATLGSVSPLFSAVRDSTSKTIEAKIALEGSLEKRLRSLLTEILGSEDVIVLINADLRTEEEQKDTGDEVMPGVPVKDNPSVPGALGTTLTMVKKIQATVIVDKATSDSDVQLIRKVTGGLLGIAPQDQSAITIEKMAFRKTPPATAADFFGPQQLWKIPWLLLAAVALILIYSGFLRQFLTVGREVAGALRAQAQNQGGSGMTRMEAAVAPHALNGKNGQISDAALDAQRNGRPFSFVREEHLSKLIYLVRRGTPEHLGMLVHYLPPELASRFLAAQDDETREKITQYLADVTELDEQAVREVEKWIRSRIDFMVGGEEKLAELLESLPEEKQIAFLAKIAAKNPVLKDHLESRLIRVDDLAKLEPTELQALLRRVPMPILAVVLKSRQDILSLVKVKLPPSLVERLTEEMALARDASSERVQADLRRILDAMKTLEREGWIVIKKESAPPHPHPLPRVQELKGEGS